MSGSGASDPIPAARRRGPSNGMPQLPLQQAHSRDGQLSGKSDTWYSTRKALCSPHEFYRQYSEAGSGPRSSNDKSSQNRQEYPQVSSTEEHIPSLNASGTPYTASYNSYAFSASASQYTPTAAPNSQLASVPATPSLSATPSVSQDTPHATGSASLMQPSPHGPPPHPNSHSSLGAVSGHPSPGHHSPFEANSPVTAAQAWQIAQRNHRSPLRHASPPSASLHVDDSPRPSTAYPNLDNPADCAALSTLDSYTCLPLPPAGQNPSGSSPIPLFQGSPYLSHALSQSPSSGPLSAGGGGRYAMPAPQARHRLTAARHRVTPTAGAAPVATGPHAVAEAAPHAGSVAPGAPRAPHNPMPQQPYASPNSAQAPEGKWPSAATTPESGRNDRNTVSSVSFMHLATAGHSTHDSPREAAPAQAGGGRVGRTRSPANVLPMLRRSADASNRRRSRHRMTPAHGRVPDRPLSANGPRTTVAAPPVLGHLHGHGPAAQRGPGRLRSRSSDSTASPQQGTAHVTAGAVSDDTSVTDHVAPEVSGATVHGEATSSPNEAVSSLSGPENSLMMLHSVESGGGAAATAAAAAAAASGRGEEESYTAPPPRRESAPPASGGAYGSTHGGPGSSSAVGRASARRTFHINHTAADGTPLTSLQPPLHLQPPSSASGISPRPRSVGPAPGGHPKDLPTVPRLRDVAGGMPPRAGGGPDSARDAGSDLGATDSITDERRYYGYGGRYRLHDVNERAAAASPSVSPVATTASRYGVSRDARATANAATASLTRTRRSGSMRRTPRQFGPGPPESGQSHDGHAQSALMRLEAPSSAGADSARVPVGRQRSGSNLYSSAYPKTGASSGGIQACTMDALAAGSASTAHAYRNVPRPESQSSITPGRTTPHYASAYSTGYPPISRRTPRARTGAYGPSSMSSVHSYTSARSSRVPGLDTMDSLVGAGADTVAAALAADTYVPQARDRTRRNAAPRPRRTVFAPQARQGAFTSLPALPMGALALRPQSGDGRSGAGRGDHGGINLDSLLATNNSADGGLLGFLDRAESARIPEPPLPFRETISDNNGEHRNPKLSGSELYSTLLGSLRESLTRGQHQVSVANGVPLSSASVAGGNGGGGGGGSLAATASIAMPSSVSGPVEPSASAPVAAPPAAAKRGASKEPSGRGGLMRRRRRHGPRLNPSALSQLQQSLDQGQHTESSVVPVHLFLPPVKITAKSRRGTLRPPRPTFAAHPSPDYSRQAREKSGSSKTVPNPPASMPQPNAPAPLAAAPGFSHGTQAHSQQGLSQQGFSQQGLSQQGLSQQGLSQVTQATSPGTLEGQASRPLSTPPTFPCGRDSPDTPTNEIGSTTTIERGRVRGTPAGAKLGVHGSPAVSQHDLPSQRGGRSQSLLRQTSHTRSLGKRVPMSSAMSDASTTDTAAAVRATASAQAAAANAAPVTVLNTATSRPTSRAWLPCMSAPRTIDEGGSESVHNGGVTTGAASTASRSVHGGNKGSSSSTRDVSSSNNGQMSLFKWGLRMSCL